MEKSMVKELIPIQNMIYEIRKQKVMLDYNLTELYEIEVKKLNQAVKRNSKRFPIDFMFQLTQEEWGILRSQIATANKNIAKVRFAPYVFTKQGVAMLSGLLNSDIAINVNIEIMRAFVRLRHFALSYTDTNEQIAELRKLLLLYIEKNDKRVNDIILALNNLIEKPKEPKTIGFTSGN